MAVRKRRRRKSIWTFGIRALGIAGLFALVLGGIGARTTPGFSFRQSAQRVWQSPNEIVELMANTADRPLQISLWLIACGAAAVVISVVLQLLGGLGRLAGRRNLVGANAAVQSALIIALVIGINAYSFQHYARWDWTGRSFAPMGWHAPLQASDRFAPKFTIPENVAADLRQLRGATDIIVYQRHKTFGHLSDKPDAYDYAAERKVVEKVQDLVRLFREFGPQFNVEILDVEDEGFGKKLDRLTDGNPALRASIDAAAENSIIFHARRGDREAVQRLSFNDFYQLDKTASAKANNGKGNLVLLPQGIESFARRVLAIEEKRPKVAVATIHEYLSTAGNEFLTMAGLRATLERQGFDVVDIILKKGWSEGEPVPAAYTIGESQLERLEEDLAEYDAVLAINRQEIQTIGTIVEKLKSNLSLDKLNEELKPMLQGRQMTEAARQVNIQRLEPQLDTLREYTVLQEKERAEVLKQLEQIPGQERLAEYKRMTDVKAKFAKLLADCDLVIVPRMTIFNAVSGDMIPPRIYRLDEAQSAAIKDFVAAGKPMLALIGPNNEPKNSRMAMRPTPPGPEPVETLLSQLGIVLGNQTVLFDVEAKAFSQRRVSLLAGASEVDVPPLKFERPKRGTTLTDVGASAKTNPIAESMKVVAGAAGSNEQLEKLKLRHPRPVYYAPPAGSNETAAEFLFTSADAWNEPNPFPSRERTPRYEPSKPGDAAFGTRDAERHESFPVGVAVETNVPGAWLNPSQPTNAKRLRVAVIGHGGVFMGPELPPAKEQLLLHTCNWLLGRDERLPHADRQAWEFPRVQLSEHRLRLWEYGTVVILPAAFAALGAFVLLVRRYR